MAAPHQKPTVVLIAVGGTISMVKDSATGRSVPVRTAAELLGQTEIAGLAKVRCLDLTVQPGHSLHLEALLALARCVQQEAQNKIDGIVVTHGTDTLEEIAYFLDEVLAISVPVVCTGAMRPGWATGYDGIRNLENAFRVAMSVPTDYGVLVTMNDEVFEAWSVYKADSGALDAFTARRGASYGRIFGNQLDVTWLPFPRPRMGKIPPNLPTAVPILTMGIGDDAVLLERLGDPPMQGVVIAGMAAGSIPPLARERVITLARHGVPVVLCSSAVSGRTAEEYYYPGAYDDLTAVGVVIENHLTPRKARIRLIISLGLQIPYVPFGRELVLT
jgi:L-asparaginase